MSVYLSVLSLVVAIFFLPGIVEDDCTCSGNFCSCSVSCHNHGEQIFTPDCNCGIFLCTCECVSNEHFNDGSNGNNDGIINSPKTFPGTVNIQRLKEAEIFLKGKDGGELLAKDIKGIIIAFQTNNVHDYYDKSQNAENRFFEMPLNVRNAFLEKFSN